jgi:colanic acid biosynthesis glycosyl transferase WcaI
MLSQGLVQRGHQVTVITTVPHYPSGRVPDSFRGKWIWRSEEQGVKVIRVGLPSVKRANLAQRLLQFSCYQLGAIWAGRSEKYDAVFVANPALWIWLPFTWFVVLRRKPSIFSIYDLYPDVGVVLGIFHHRPVIATVAALERFCLNRSVIVRIISESFRPGLRALKVPDAKMALVHDYVDTDLIRPLPRDNPFAREHGLADRFVLLYAGNLGLSQGLEHVLVAAERLAGCPELRFVFVGDGGGRDLLVARTEQLHLANVQFIPFQPRARLPEVLASADISLITLRRGIGAGSMPSKAFSILASGRPVLASVDPGSETWKLIERAGAGLCVPPEDPAALVDAILTLKQNRALRERLGINGRIWAEQHHSPESAAEQFEKLFQAALLSHSMPRNEKMKGNS